MAINNSNGATNGVHINETIHGGNASQSPRSVLVVGAGPVGCLTALKLAQAGIQVDIIERLSATSESPRACGYFGAVQFFLNEIGMYSKVREDGFMTRGLCWRKKPVDDGKGGKKFGDTIAIQPLCAPDDENFELGAGLLNLPQADLNKLFLREALKTGLVRVQFNTELHTIVENTPDGVVVLARNTETGEDKQYKAKYLVAADGARSSTRKALGLPFPGHTWPERLISTNVLVKNELDAVWHTYYVLDQVNFTVVTPLQRPVPGQTTLWRFTMAADPEDPRSDEELATDANILSLYERSMAGSRPLKVQIKDRAVYRIHQRLSPTMRKGNCLLAGDAGHANNVSSQDSLVISRLTQPALWGSWTEHRHARCRCCGRCTHYGSQRRSIRGRPGCLFR